MPLLLPYMLSAHMSYSKSLGQKKTRDNVYIPYFIKLFPHNFYTTQVIGQKWDLDEETVNYDVEQMSTNEYVLFDQTAQEYM